MSPARRKKAARAPRGAGRGARAALVKKGKAGGAARGAARLAKKKTPQGRKGHRGGRRVGAAVTGTAGARDAVCEMPREELEILLDRDGGRGDVLSHVPACHPCTTSLTVIAAQRDAIRHLTAEPAGTAVEYLLGRGARAGTKKLADLVYELAKACVAVVQDMDRRLRIVERPRGLGQVERDVRNALERRGDDVARDYRSRLPAESVKESDALVATQSCLAILQDLEGNSARHDLTLAVCLICSDHPGRARGLMSSFLARGNARAMRQFAFWNLMWALIREGSHDEVIEVGRRALEEFPDDWSATFNLVVAAANAGRADLFEEFSSRLRRIRARSDSDREFRRGLVTFEVPRLAEPLRMNTDAVARHLGVVLGKRVTANAST